MDATIRSPETEASVAPKERLDPPKLPTKTFKIVPGERTDTGEFIYLLCKYEGKNEQFFVFFSNYLISGVARLNETRTTGKEPDGVVLVQCTDPDTTS